MDVQVVRDWQWFHMDFRVLGNYTLCLGAPAGYAPERSVFDSPGDQPLPALTADTEDPPVVADDSKTVVVDGNPVQLDKLGPVVVNVDGSISRINNWHEMTEMEQKNTLRLIG